MQYLTLKVMRSIC